MPIKEDRKTLSDINSQIADYICWAIFVRHERKEKRPFIAIRDKIRAIIKK